MRAVLTALRAAAIVLIATGINEVVAGAVPRYEPLYVFLAAAALVVLLDGVVLGVLASIAGTIIYALLYMPRPAALSPAVAEPLGWSLTAVAIAALVRGVIRARARRTEPMPELFPRTPPMLDAPPPEAPPPPVPDTSGLLLAIEELRADLREREASLERSYVSRLQAADEERARLAQLLEAERAQRDRLDVAAREVEAEVRRRADATAAENEVLRGEVEAARNEEEAARVAFQRLRAETEQLRAALAAARTAVETARAEAASNAREVAALRAGSDEMRRTLEVERARNEGERNLRTTAVDRVAELERALGAERAGRQGEANRHAEKIAALEQAAADERALRERLELDAQTRDAAAATLRARVAELERSLESARLRAADEEQRLGAALETRKAEEETLRARIAELERSLDSTRIGAEEEHVQRERFERELQTSVDESAMLRARITELEQELTEIAAGHEQEERVLRARIAELEAAAAATSAEFDQKLHTIVSHLASDHETDLGKAVEEREEARAEARSMTLRLKKVDEERQALLAKLREVEERYRQSIEDSTLLLEQTRTAAQGEIDRLHGRVAELENGFAVASPLPPPPVARPRVLIAHPDADLRMSARTSLERAGYEVVSAADGLEALRTAIAERPDVVIADVTMPKMDGRELCQLLKSQEKTSHIRVVLLLRVGDEAPKGELCPDEVLRKPVPLEILKSTLAGLVTRTPG